MAVKGRFTQCVVVLLKAPLGDERLSRLLAPYEPVRSGSTRQDDPPSEWFFGTPDFLIPYRPGVNGWVEIDQVCQPWPDSMGDPKSDPDLFGAWAAGCFGLCWPGSLAGACEPAWLPDELRAAPQAHRAFLRVRSSYLVNARPDAPVRPADYDPVAELNFVTRIAQALSRTPEAFAYFNPAGQRILLPSDLDAALERAEAQGIIPIDVWANTRLFHLAPAAPDWRLMDTIGLIQLDAPDHEVCYPDDAWDPNDSAAFLWNTASYVVKNGPVIAKGDTIDSAGGALWRAVDLGQARVGPLRRVISWRPAAEPVRARPPAAKTAGVSVPLVSKLARVFGRGTKPG